MVLLPSDSLFAASAPELGRIAAGMAADDSYSDLVVDIQKILVCGIKIIYKDKRLIYHPFPKSATPPTISRGCSAASARSESR